MPYLALDLDAFDDAQAVASATGLPLQHVLGGLALLWRWSWRGKVDRAAGEQICALFGSTHAALLPSLVAFGFLEAGDTYRVRGVDRYLRLSEVRAKAGRERAAKALRGASGQLLAASTQPAADQHVLDSQPAPSQQPTSPFSEGRRSNDSPSENPRAAPADRPLQDQEAARAFALEEQVGKRPRKRSRQEVLYSALSAHRREVLGPDALPDERWSVQRQNEALGGEILDCDPDLLLAGLRRFLESPFAGRCSPPGPVGVFVNQWSRWVDVEMKARSTE